MPLTSRRFASSHNISKGCQGDSGFRGNSNSRVWVLLRIERRMPADDGIAIHPAIVINQRIERT
jgi:hypothetical protein